jgi:SIR2-like domain
VIDPLNSLAFSVYENKAVYCLLLGSGVSRAAEIPTGWEITLDLVRRVAALEGVTDQVNWASWYKDAHGKEPGYSDLLDQLAATADERRSILHSYIEPNEDDSAVGKKMPTKAHRAIARLVQAGYVRVIFTTNFDRLTENALRDVGVEPTVIASEDALKGAVPLIHSRCYVVRLHGDYLDTRTLNTETELSTYSATMNSLLDRIIDEHGLIICGWSGDWDPALRAAIARAPNRRYPMYWATRGESSKVAADLITQRVGRVIEIDSADIFFERLERQVSTQAELRKQNPQSIELMVASTKRFLAKLEFRIQLDELVGEEVRRIERMLGGPDFPAQGDFSREIVVQRIARYESLTEVLARVVSIMGRWGDGSEFRLVEDVLTQLGNRDPAAGFTQLLNLRNYPAVLVLYGYGLGLLCARRLEDLFKLFSLGLINQNNQKVPMADHLLLQSWRGNDDNTFKLLPGRDQSRAALSDHLHNIFKTWSSDMSFLQAEYTRLFEEFEMLGALANITLRASKPDLTAKRAKQDFLWCPMGRACWDGRTYRMIVDGWRDEKVIDSLLHAGFARRDRDFLTLAIENLHQVAANTGRH